MADLVAHLDRGPVDRHHPLDEHIARMILAAFENDAPEEVEAKLVRTLAVLSEHMDRGEARESYEVLTRIYEDFKEAGLSVPAER